MTLLGWIILLFVVGLVLIVAEVCLPTHGALGVLACGAIMGGVGCCFFLDRWLGMVTLTAVLLALPVAAVLLVKYWPKTPVGRRLILQPAPDQPAPLAVQIGQTGVCISELRPMGMCEFGGKRVEARSEFGIIASGQKVKVVGIADRLPVVAVVGA